MSVWGTLASHAQRASILSEIFTLAGLPFGMPRGTKITCEAGADGSLAPLLNETGGNAKTKCVDALIKWPDAFVAVESKFTEPSFGVCGQVRRRTDRPPDGPRTKPVSLPAACDGTYGAGSDHKTHTRAPCRLQTWDGTRAPRLYWQMAWELFRPEVLVPDGRPCPFAGPSFQLMRNLALARAAAAPYSKREDRGKPPVVKQRQWGLLVAHVGAHPVASGHRREIDAFKKLLLPEVRERVGLVSYEQINQVLREHSLGELAAWIDQRIAAALAS